MNFPLQTGAVLRKPGLLLKRPHRSGAIRPAHAGYGCRRMGCVPPTTGAPGDLCCDCDSRAQLPACHCNSCLCDYDYVHDKFIAFCGP